MKIDKLMPFLFISAAFPLGCTHIKGDALVRPPTNLVATAGIRMVTLTWDPFALAESYSVHWTNDGAAISVPPSELPHHIISITAPFTLERLIPGSTYYFYVSVKHGVSESYSARVEATPLGP